nr:NAD(P)-dependent oxidoreductase [Kibdelosporangium sp. MJ126-NF4]CEL18023.1 D-3-phosphoglycerate dehydrogenase [Kibdelosporangium sp. MJ126-NF4]CTQ90749.1 D-3-phosphoglycerate dehydrogenase (EC 1.1.1.95) [Kibdelosporangium sp. MJ126-NF4]
MADRRILYTDPAWLVHNGKTDPARATVETEILGPDVELVFGPHANGRYAVSSPELLHRAAGADVIVIYRCRVTPELLDAAGPRLRAVIRHGVGIDNLNADLLAERGIKGYNIPDYCVDEVSTHTTMLALALERRLLPQHSGLVGGTFDIYAGGAPRRLRNHTLGIVGFGRIGRAVARKLGVHFGQTLVFDPYIGRDLSDGYGATAVDTLDDLLAAADLVTLHCPLTQETEAIMDRVSLKAMKEGSYLVNAARGKLVDPVALAEALQSGRLAGAGIDVFSPENPHDDPAWWPVLAHPNVVVTSHRAFLSVEAEASSRRRAAELARDVLNGQYSVVGAVT